MILVERVNALARWWPCWCFRPAKSTKNVTCLRCMHALDLVLKCCSDINEGNWIQFLFYLLVLVIVAASFIGMSFFLSVGQFVG